MQDIQYIKKRGQRFYLEFIYYISIKYILFSFNVYFPKFLKNYIHFKWHKSDSIENAFRFLQSNIANIK